MKKGFKISMAVIVISVATFFAACNNNSGDAKGSEKDTTKTEM